MLKNRDGPQSSSGVYVLTLERSENIKKRWPESGLFSRDPYVCDSFLLRAGRRPHLNPEKEAQRCYFVTSEIHRTGDFLYLVQVGGGISRFICRYLEVF